MQIARLLERRVLGHGGNQFYLGACMGPPGPTRIRAGRLELSLADQLWQPLVKESARASREVTQPPESVVRYSSGNSSAHSGDDFLRKRICVVVFAISVPSFSSSRASYQTYSDRFEDPTATSSLTLT